MEEIHRLRLDEAADWIVPRAKKAKFSMGEFRDIEADDESNPVCSSTGCFLGYVTELFPKWRITIPRIAPHVEIIDFWKVAEYAFGISSTSNDWSYLFSSEWAVHEDSAETCRLRIKEYLNNGLPDDWEAMLNGDAPLTYLEE